MDVDFCCLVPPIPLCHVFSRLLLNAGPSPMGSRAGFRRLGFRWVALKPKATLWGIRRQWPYCLGHPDQGPKLTPSPSGASRGCACHRQAPCSTRHPPLPPGFEKRKLGFLPPSPFPDRCLSPVPPPPSAGLPSPTPTPPAHLGQRATPTSHPITHGWATGIRGWATEERLGLSHWCTPKRVQFPV